MIIHAPLVLYKWTHVMFNHAWIPNMIESSSAFSQFIGHLACRNCMRSYYTQHGFRSSRSSNSVRNLHSDGVLIGP